MTKPDSHPIPLKAILAGPPLAAMAALGMAPGDTAPPKPEAAHTADAPAQTDEFQLKNGDKIKLPGLGLLGVLEDADTVRPPKGFSIDHSLPKPHPTVPEQTVSIDKAAKIAESLFDPAKPKPRPEVHTPPPERPRHLPPPTPIPEAVLPPPPQPEQPTPETSVERPAFKIHEVSQEAAEVMRSETVLLQELGCSGFLIRNKEGVPVGVLTAEHCQLAGFKTRRYKGDDGKTYVAIYNDKVTVKTGDTLQNMQSIGNIDRFIVNAEDDMEKDVAFGVFEGHTPEEVLENYQHLSEDEIHNLKPGDVVYSSGWPAYQPKNPMNNERQQFALTVAAIENGWVTTGEHINVVWTILPKNQDETECSYRNSGSEGFIMVDEAQADGSIKRLPKSVGTAAIFSDLTGADLAGDNGRTHNPAIAKERRAFWEQHFGLDLSEAAAICGWAYEIPTPEDGSEVVNVINYERNIPGYEEKYGVYASEQRARKHLADPSTTKYYIEGKFQVGGGTSEEGDFTLLADKTVVYHDDELRRTVFAYGDLQAEGGIGLYTVDDRDFEYFSIMDRDDSPGVDIKPFTGRLIASNNLLVGEAGEIVSEIQAIRGWLPPVNPEDAYHLYLDQDNKLQTYSNRFSKG